MTTSEHLGSPCIEVLNAVVMFIDGEIGDSHQVKAIESHLEACAPCRSEISHERRIHQMLHDVLTRSCCEVAPQELHDQIAAMVFGSTGFITETTTTEISIQIDEFGQVERHEITIEHTQEIRLPHED